ncbi:MAG TPA: hypothetical protein VMG81_02800 [Thermoplasmata archaeon]|nr:hypothetical protein [Thermoplasmata archaeon]
MRDSERGVVAVVGTLLALLVFFALFGVFLTQYVPLWMVDNESAFTAQSAASFAQLKANVDLQYALDGPPVYGTPFTLQSAGVPLIAAASQGTLTFIPTNCPPQSVTGYSQQVPFYTAAIHPAGTTIGQPVVSTDCVFENLTIGYGPGSTTGATGGGNPYYQEVTSGTLQMVLANRYYPAQEFFFENDGVIQAQPGGYQIMAFPPPLNVSTVAGNTTVSTSFLQLYGNATAIVGQQSQQVFSTLRYAQYVTTNGLYYTSNTTYRPTNFTFEIGTEFPCAWYSYLQSVMSTSGLLNTTQYKITEGGSTNPPTITACENPTGITTIVELNIFSFKVSYVTLFYAGAQISLGVGGS